MQKSNGKSQPIVTLLKFVKSSQNDALISYVSENPVTKLIKGVREDYKYPHKVVVCGASVIPHILANVLYRSTIIPMKSGAGYVCIAVEPVKFQAKIQARYVPKSTYQILVSFGNKVMVYDPFKGEKASVLCESEFINTLEHRYDIANLQEIINAFQLMSTELKHAMKKDGVKARLG